MYRKKWINTTEYRLEQLTAKGYWRGASEESAGYLAWIDAGNTPAEIAYIAPTLEQQRASKLAEIEIACTAAQEAGVLTTPGLTMKFGVNDCTLVDGIVRYAELKGLSTIPKLIEADGTEHTDVSLADGQVIRLEQFEAAYAADAQLTAKKAAIAEADAADLAAITWE